MSIKCLTIVVFVLIAYTTCEPQDKNERRSPENTGWYFPSEVQTYNGDTEAKTSQQPTFRYPENQYSESNRNEDNEQHQNSRDSVTPAIYNSAIIYEYHEQITPAPNFQSAQVATNSGSDFENTQNKSVPTRNEYSERNGEQSTSNISPPPFTAPSSEMNNDYNYSPQSLTNSEDNRWSGSEDGRRVSLPLDDRRPPFPPLPPRDYRYDDRRPPFPPPPPRDYRYDARWPPPPPHRDYWDYHRWYYSRYDRFGPRRPPPPYRHWCTDSCYEGYSFFSDRRRPPPSYDRGPPPPPHHRGPPSFLGRPPPPGLLRPPPYDHRPPPYDRRPPPPRSGYDYERYPPPHRPQSSNNGNSAENNQAADNISANNYNQTQAAVNQQIIDAIFNRNPEIITQYGSNKRQALVNDDSANDAPSSNAPPRLFQAVAVTPET